jgi:hypothetical protein
VYDTLRVSIAAAGIANQRARTAIANPVRPRWPKSSSRYCSAVIVEF